MTRDEYIKLLDLKEMVDSDRGMRIKAESLKARGEWDYYNNCPLVPDKLRNEMLKERKTQMTRDEIIRMAREAGFRQPNPHDGYMGLAYDYRDGTDTGASLERFATLVEAEVEGRWKSAVIDELITCHIYTASHENNPRKALQDAISWNVQVALDPLVSSDAQSLIDHAMSKEREECAKACEARVVGDHNREDAEAKRCAAAIRARGNK